MYFHFYVDHSNHHHHHPYRDLEEGTKCGSGHGYYRERRGGLPQHYGWSVCHRYSRIHQLHEDDPRILWNDKDQTGTTSSQAGHQLQSTNQCWVEVSPHHQISCHWGVLHIIILSVQGWKIHHFQVFTRGLQGHPGWVHQRVPQMSYYPRWVERTGEGIQDQVACSTCPGSPGWEACGPEQTQEHWSPLPQLQGVLFHCNVGPGRWTV